jgi:hypothetical protein
MTALSDLLIKQIRQFGELACLPARRIVDFLGIVVEDDAVNNVTKVTGNPRVIYSGSFVHDFGTITTDSSSSYGIGGMHELQAGDHAEVWTAVSTPFFSIFAGVDVGEEKISVIAWNPTSSSVVTGSRTYYYRVTRHL